ncbi:MAG TPA: BtpA/SgcQ family protein, partial [Planctomycetota bacterium]|nr:BtpA/SgcQ family protein [Planctomycetota bacterium]
LVGRADETLRVRRTLCPDVAILADVHVKHATPLGGGEIGLSARDVAYRGLADAIVVSGAETGAAVDLEELRAVRRAVPDRTLLAGSGVTPENAAEVLSIADGAIVGTSCERGGKTGAPVDPVRVRALVRAAR